MSKTPSNRGLSSRLRPRYCKGANSASMRLHDEEEIELTCLKSFKEQTPQRLLCSIPMISLRRMMGGVPRALNAEAGLAVAFCRMRARSASLNVPSCWRLSLKILINSAQRCCKKYLFPHPPKVQCSQSGSRACALAAATRKSCGFKCGHTADLFLLHKLISHLDAHMQHNELNVSIIFGTNQSWESRR